MGIFFTYILKSSIILAMMFAAYSLMLSKETFHRTNRVMLISIAVIALIFPALQSKMGSLIEKDAYIINIEGIEHFLSTAIESTGQTQLTQREWIAMSVIVLYLLGVVACSVRYIISILRVTYIIRHTEKRQLDDNVTLCLHDKSLTPFSYFGYIVMSRSDYQEGAVEIITHEKAHIEMKHSFDLMFIELICLLMWFNPVAWLLKRELKNIHEYEADKAVLNTGVNPKEYQLMLIKKAFGNRIYTAVNNFNHCLTKKRIIMMLRQKSNKLSALKYLLFVPVMMIGAVAIARPEIKEIINDIENVDLSTIKKAAITADTTKANKQLKTGQAPVYPDGGVKGLMQYVMNQIKDILPKENLMVIANFIINKEGKAENVVLKGKDISDEKLRQLLTTTELEKIKKVIETMPAWTPAKGLNGTPESANMALAIAFRTTGKVVNITRPNADEKVVVIYIKDGKEQTITIDAKEMKDNKIIKSLKPAEIKSMTVIKNGKKQELTISAEGEKHLSTKASDKDGKKKKNIIYIVDGKKMTEEEVGKIEKDKIKAVTVIKNPEILKKHGAKEGDTVIEVVLKK